MSSRVGVGPSKAQISSFTKEELPIYIKFSGTKCPTYKISQIIRDAIDPSVFAGKVVMIGTNFSYKK